MLYAVMLDAVSYREVVKENVCVCIKECYALVD